MSAPGAVALVLYLAGWAGTAVFVIRDMNERSDMGRFLLTMTCACWPVLLGIAAWHAVNDE